MNNRDKRTDEARDTHWLPRHVRRPVLTIVLAASAIALLQLSARAAEEQAAPAAAADTNGHSIVVAVLPLALSAPDEHLQPLVDAMGDMLVVHLSHHPKLKLVDRGELDRLLSEQSLAALVRQPSEQARFGKLLGAEWVIVGGVTVTGKQLITSLRLVEVTTARIAGATSGKSSAEAIMELVAKAGDDLMNKMDLDLGELPESRVDTSADANQQFMRGLGFYFGQMPEHASAHFMQALATDPTHAEARWWNARVYFEGKEYAHAQVELAKFLRDHAASAHAARAKEMLSQCKQAKSTESR